jgi:[phosphatase 2A protein]-leucine-carboxy methyltransferase
MSAGLRRLGPSRRDRIIQATDVDALASKYSSVCKGYIHDPYIELLVEGIRNDKRNREGFIPKLPLINRGEFNRKINSKKI